MPNNEILNPFQVEFVAIDYPHEQGYISGLQTSIPIEGTASTRLAIRS